MKVSDTPSALKQIRKTPWKFQQTFKTPLNNLQPFVAAILSTASPESACITIEQAVFEPKHWIDLLKSLFTAASLWEGSIYYRCWTARSRRVALHSFLRLVRLPFRPHSKTVRDLCRSRRVRNVYANTRSNLNRVVEALSAQGVEEVAEYGRQL
jgi:hypothetical protein